MRPALARRPQAEFLLRMLTVVLTSAMLVLGVLAAHHEANASASSGHAITSDVQDPHGIAAEATDFETVAASASVFATLAAGCAFLTLCCIFALAVLNRGQRLAALARYLGAMPARQQRQQPFGLAAFALQPAPSLISLSISRT